MQILYVFKDGPRAFFLGCTISGQNFRSLKKQQVYSGDISRFCPADAERQKQIFNTLPTLHLPQQHCCPGCLDGSTFHVKADIHRIHLFIHAVPKYSNTAAFNFQLFIEFLKFKRVAEHCFLSLIQQRRICKFQGKFFSVQSRVNQIRKQDLNVIIVKKQALMSVVITVSSCAGRQNIASITAMNSSKSAFLPWHMLR